MWKIIFLHGNPLHPFGCLGNKSTVWFLSRHLRACFTAEQMEFIALNDYSVRKAIVTFITFQAHLSVVVGNSMWTKTGRGTRELVFVVGADFRTRKESLGSRILFCGLTCQQKTEVLVNGMWTENGERDGEYLGLSTSRVRKIKKLKVVVTPHFNS